MKIIQSFLKYRPSRDYIIKEANLAWLKLSINVPADEIYKEFLSVKDMLVLHRSEDKYSNLANVGWKSLTIYGIAPDVTVKSEQKHDWTTVAEKCPFTVNWIKEHFEINNNTGRIRFMLLEPGGYILPHVDRDTVGLKETNIAITNPKNCRFQFLDRGKIPFEPGSAFLIDTSKKHMVVNNSEEDRLHIIVHSNIKSGIIEKSYEDSFYN